MRSLPKVVSGIPNDLRAFVDRVREYIGNDSEDRFVTLRELRKGGIVGTTPGGTIIPPGETGVENPIVPTGLTASGAFAIIFLEWDTPNYLGHSHTEVWAADTDDFSAKVLVGTTGANVFGHDIGTGASKYYWIRFVNALGTAGPYNDTAGTLGTTSQDPDYLIDVLSDAYGVTGDAPFFQLDTPTTINGVLIPAGTYIKQAWIADATISRAKIQDLAVDNAKINDLAVNKLTAGTMQVGSYIQSQSYVAGTSGWKINADGSAEFSNVTVRGTVAGSTILGGSATTYSSGTGLFAGLDAGTYKFRVGNPSGNRLQWTGSALNIVGAITGSTISGSTITVNTAALSGTTMTGSGAVFNSSGTFAIGNSTTNITFNGTTMTFNGSVVGTANIQAQAVSETVTGQLTGTNAIAQDILTLFNLPSFTAPAAGRYLVQVVMTVHNFSTGTNRDVQIEAYVNNQGLQGSAGVPILRCVSSGTNAAFMPLPPVNTTGGSSVQIAASDTITVTQGQVVPVQVGATASAVNTTLYLTDTYYIATLLKR